MTEETIKECKNCEALGIDSEIGVYYCCLSHRQDDLPKEFMCNDFIPNEQLKHLEQERDDIQDRLFTLADTYQEARNVCKRLEQENKELKEMLSKEPKAMQAFQIAYSGLKKDNEVLWGVVKDYRSALEEIREINNKWLKHWMNDSDEIAGFEEIESKISEALQ